MSVLNLKSVFTLKTVYFVVFSCEELAVVSLGDFTEVKITFRLVSLCQKKKFVLLLMVSNGILHH